MNIKNGKYEPYVVMTIILAVWEIIVLMVIDV